MNTEIGFFASRQWPGTKAAAGAKRRLADEYDAAQPKDAAVRGRPKSVETRTLLQLPRLAFTRKDIHEARIIRDAEADEPGIIRRKVDAAATKKPPLG